MNKLQNILGIFIIAAISTAFCVCIYKYEDTRYLRSMSERALELQEKNADAYYVIDNSLDTADVLFGIAMAEKYVANPNHKYTKGESVKLQTLGMLVQKRLALDGILTNPFYQLRYIEFCIGTSLAETNSTFRSGYFASLKR